MKYPTEILPCPDYKLIECDLSNLTLVRSFMSIENEQDIDSSTGNINIKLIAHPTENINDYSTNLLGIFELSHLKIALTASGKELYSCYCRPNEEIEPPIFQLHYSIDDERKYFTIKISDIINLKIPYKYNEQEMKASCIICHSPMRWNYWHFSLRWLLQNGEWLHEVPKKGWTRKIASTSRAILVHLISLQFPNYYVIENSQYINQ
jgi:hypothetical protein